MLVGLDASEFVERWDVCLNSALDAGKHLYTFEFVGCRNGFGHF